MANIVNAGFVFKDDGTAVSGATVSVLQADTSTSVATGTTNSDGYYSITTTTENANAYNVKITSGSSDASDGLNTYVLVFLVFHQ